MTPEREFVDFVEEEAKKRGISSFFVVVMNDKTEKFSYSMHAETSNVTIASTMLYLKNIFDKAATK